MNGPEMRAYCHIAFDETRATLNTPHTVKLLADTAGQHIGRAMLNADRGEGAQAALDVLEAIELLSAAFLTLGALADALLSRFGRGPSGSGTTGPTSPAPGTLTNQEVREWYHAQLEAIPKRIDASLPLKDQALRAFALRNEIKLQARALMADRAAAAALPPPSTLEQVLQRAYDQGLRGDDVWRYVLQGSQRSNAAVDAALGLKR